MNTTVRRKALAFFSLYVIAAFPLLAGDQPETAGSPVAEQTETITVTDILGREVTVEGRAETVAWTHYGTPEALKILDAWELSVAGGPWVSDESLYPGFADMPKLFGDTNNQYQPNLEALIDIAPDLLIVEVIPLPGLDELLASLEGVLPVVCVQLVFPGSMNASYEMLGRLIDREEEAAEYIAWVEDMKAELVAITDGLPEEARTPYFFKTGTGAVDQVLTYTNEMEFALDRDAVIGGVNIAGDLPGYGGWVMNVDPEWLVQQEYEVLIIADAVYGAYGSRVGDPSMAAEHRDAVLALPAFSGSVAARAGRVYAVSEIFAGSNIILSYPYFAKMLHPDLFEDLDPVAIHQEYLTRFLDSDANISDTGVYVYPPVR